MEEGLRPLLVFIALLVCLVLVISGLIVTAAAATQQDPVIDVALPDGRVVRPESNAEMQQLIRLLVEVGDTASAARLIRAWQPQHPDHAVRVAYVDGLIAARRGDDPEAVRIWRGILAARPDLDLVRVQLTRALVRLDLTDSAREQGERLIAAGVDDRLGGQVQGLLRSLDDRRPATFSAYLSVLPSSNVNNGTENKTVPIGPVLGAIPKDQQRKSGLGVAAGGQLAWRRALSPETALIAALDGRVEHFASIDRTNVTAELSFGAERRLSRGKLLTRVIAGGAMVDGDETYRYTGLAVEANVRLGDRWRLYAGPELRLERFASTSAQDGPVLDIPVQLDRFGGPDRFTRFIAGAAFGRKEADRFSFDEVRLGIGHFREFRGGITVYGEIVAAKRDYRAPFPGIAEPRRDERLSISATFTKRDLVIAGFAPRLTLRTERQRSNAAFYDIDRSEIDFRLVRDF